MIKLLAVGSAVFAGVVSLPAPISTHQQIHHPAPDYRKDPRLHCLRTFFANAGCPAVAYVTTFLEAADRYKLDWRLLPSISFIESTGGKAARNNNFFGWDGGRASFPSPVAAIHNVGYQLAHSNLYRDKGTDEILATYNPNADYAVKVKWVMRQIAPTSKVDVEPYRQ